MAISRARKEELVALYADLIDRSDAIFMSKYTGMTVKDLEELRGVVREANGAVHVTKNTLLALALEQKGQPVPEELLKGQVAATFSLGDAPSMAKALLKQEKALELFEISGAVFGGQVIGHDDVDSLSNMPSMDEMRSQLLSLVSGNIFRNKMVRLTSGPQRNIATVLSAGVRQVLNVVDAYAKKEEA